MSSILFLSDSTLTLTNLCDALKDMEDVIGLGTYLNVPMSKLDQINRQYDIPLKQKQATLLNEWLTAHPAPSWRVVAEAIYQSSKHDTLKKVQEFVKGIFTIGN